LVPVLIKRCPIPFFVVVSRSKTKAFSNQYESAQYRVTGYFIGFIGIKVILTDKAD
jgi:hypothetical protein